MLKQYPKIYTGEYTNWNQVGGASGEIVLIGREAGSGTRDGFESIQKPRIYANTVRSLPLQVT